MKNDRKLFLYIAMSLDGYIAAQDDDLSFLGMVEKEGEDYGYGEFMATIDTIILGRKTYDKIRSMGFPYPPGDQHVYVITRTARPATDKISYYTGSLITLVSSLKEAPGEHIFCDGGAEIINELLKNGLIDEIIVSIIPILLGGGVRLFKDGRPEQKLELRSVSQFESGLTQLHYASHFSAH